MKTIIAILFLCMLFCAKQQPTTQIINAADYENDDAAFQAAINVAFYGGGILYLPVVTGGNCHYYVIKKTN